MMKYIILATILLAASAADLGTCAIASASYFLAPKLNWGVDITGKTSTLKLTFQGAYADFFGCLDVELVAPNKGITLPTALTTVPAAYVPLTFVFDSTDPVTKFGCTQQIFTANDLYTCPFVMNFYTKRSLVGNANMLLLAISMSYQISIKKDTTEYIAMGVDAKSMSAGVVLTDITPTGTLLIMNNEWTAPHATNKFTFTDTMKFKYTIDQETVKNTYIVKHVKTIFKCNTSAYTIPTNTAPFTTELKENLGELRFATVAALTGQCLIVLNARLQKKVILRRALQTDAMDTQEVSKNSPDFSVYGYMRVVSLLVLAILAIFLI